MRVREYSPHRWALVRFSSDRHNQEPVLKVLGSWYGGFVGSDEWRLSSGVSEIHEKGDHWEIHNASGSIYRCGKHSYGLSTYTASILAGWERQAAEANDGELIEVERFDDFTAKVFHDPYGFDPALNIKTSFLTEEEHTERCK